VPPWLALPVPGGRLADYPAQKALLRFTGQGGRVGCTPAQAALAWVLAEGEDIVPYREPSTRAIWKRTSGY
jgi:aryl-alcohol dehydrogenase-like predicted oxidoreductase